MPPDGASNTDPATEEHGSKAFTLDAILNGDKETFDHPNFVEKAEGGWDEETKDEGAAQGFCVECEGTYFRQNQRTLGLAGLKTESVARSACPGLLRDLLG